MEIIIIGAGGHGRVVLDILQRVGVFRPVGFLDSNSRLHGRRVDGLPVLGDLSQLPVLASRGIRHGIVAIGDNGVRREMAASLEQAGFEIANAIHPSANIANSATLGRGVVVAAGALICAHCQVGDYAVLNTGCIVDHESMIGLCTHICPGVRLAGHTTIESGVIVGIGATVIQNVRIGFDAVVGAGAVVIEDVDPMTTVVGVPAKSIKDSPSPQEFASLISPYAS